MKRFIGLVYLEITFAVMNLTIKNLVFIIFYKRRGFDIEDRQLLQIF